MTRKKLEQVYHLNNELKMWQRRLAELQADIALSPKVMDGMPYTNTNNVGTPTEEKAIKLAEVAKVIEGKISEIQIALMEIEIYISSIDDSLMRQILEYRCCKLNTWAEVAEKLGKGFTAEAARQTYHRFMKELPVA